jgi:voltage-gated potassium channel Kch
MELVSPGSLEFVEGEPEVLERAVGYFSLVTFTTVGFGDVTPVTPLARRLAMLEGFIGQLYPAIIIGWMVSSMRPRGRD